MSKNKGSIGAWDLMQKLKQDPKWVAQDKARQEKHKAFDDMLAANEAPILKDILAAGLEIDSVWDLVNTGYSYPEAIPVLLKHLHKDYHHRIREGMIRALNTAEARGLASDVILEDLQKEKDPNFRFVLANTLHGVAVAEQKGQIETLLADPDYKDVHRELKAVLKRLVRAEKKTQG